MGDLTDTSTFADSVPNLNVKIVYVVVPDTDGSGSTVTIPNMKTIYMAMAYDPSDNSVAACTFATNVVTITGDETSGVRILVLGV